MPRVKNKILLSILCFVLFVVIVLGIDYLFYNDAKQSFNGSFSYKGTDLLRYQGDKTITDGMEATEEEIQKMLTGIENSIKNSDIKLFKNLLIFNVFIENNFEAKNSDNQTVGIKFNIDKDGNYEEVLRGERKTLLKNRTLSNLKNINLNIFTYKIEAPQICNNTNNVRLAVKNDDIKFNIELSSLSFIIFLLISLPSAWGILLLANSIYKFVVYGKPFREE